MLNRTSLKMRYIIVPLIILTLWTLIGLFVNLAMLYSNTYLLASVVMGLITVMLAIVFLILTGALLDYLGLPHLLNAVEHFFERVEKFW